MVLAHTTWTAQVSGEYAEQASVALLALLAGRRSGDHGAVPLTALQEGLSRHAASVIEPAQDVTG